MFPAWALSASLPQQERLAAETLQEIEPTEEADTLLVEDYKGEEVQESGAMDGEAGLSSVETRTACEASLPQPYCSGAQQIQERQVYCDTGAAVDLGQAMGGGGEGWTLRLFIKWVH